ncbi:Small subunit processome component 20 -like protein [Collichthys lucidus]|uniref:Small subunit processome component 20-like protein n=1 Tax=Collichthys lucidus TaxID=240159 RepID=A0A4U5VQX2_COLLU|nr:Small subunit processome component 20 -like protein [Collichthys lucidus]
MKIKSKSSYHKSENTYRFLTFAERLANVNIDVIHRIDRTGSYAEEVETYFSEGLTKWRDLNLTEHFSMYMHHFLCCRLITTFLKEVSSKSQSFNLLVFHQKSIVESLKTHLSVKDSLAYQPLLDLVVQLARDLQTDFYPHFPDFFILITSLLETKDTEVLEWAFTCLSYLYKYLWRLMFVQHAAGTQEEHIRNFAAESFSFLMRKAFPIALRKLGPTTSPGVSLPWDTVKDALDHMAQAAANHVDREHLLVLWESLQVSVVEVLDVMEAKGEEADQATEQLERLLFILHTLVSHRDGAKITKPEAVCQAVLRLTQSSSLSAPCSRLLLQITSSLLLGENITLPNALIQETVQKVFGSTMGQDLIIEFTKEMFTMKQFEQLFLPTLLRFTAGLFSCGDPLSRHFGLDALVSLILAKAPPPTDGSMAFETYPLLFTGQTTGRVFSSKEAGTTSEQPAVPELVLSLIRFPDGENQSITDLSLPWAALVLLPHLRPLSPASVVPAVTALLNHLLREIETDKLGKAGLFVARQAMSCLLTLDGSAELLSLITVDKINSILRKFPTDLSALLLGDLYYTRLSLSGVSEHLSHNALLELYQILHANLSSNISKIRLLTLRILSQFEAELPPQAEGEENVEVQPVFAVCLQAELVPASVQDYREKLLHLRKLRHDLVQRSLPQGPAATFQQVPLRYLIAMLFINFRPLWDAVIELLVTHARGMDNKDFWGVYHEHLEMVAGLAEKELQEDDDDEEEGLGLEAGTVGVLFLEQLKLTSDPNERTDFPNFRSLLWRSMTQFPERVEPRSRELSPLLLRFIRNEFYPADLLVAPTQDLRKKNDAALEESGMAVEEEEEDRDEEEQEEGGGKQQRKALPRRAAAKQLITHLKVFTKFSNPRSLYLESSLSELYNELLCHQDQQIQRVALECVLTYKDPNIVPYKILFGRLRSKAGSKFQGKASAASRSSIILRFLAGCQAEELGIFIDLLLQPVCHHSQGSCLAAVDRAVAETDLGAVLPLGRQHSLLNIINVVIHKLGHLIDIYLPKVLQILLCITASVSTILDNRDQLRSGCISPLKNLRRFGILRIQDFFDAFDSYSFSPDELDAVFQAVVWPQRTNQPECDGLLNVFALLSAKKASPVTIAMVMDIAESLATTEDFVASEVETELSVNGCVFPKPQEGAADSLSQGSRLLLPHITTLLQYLSGVVRNTDRLKKKKFRAQVAKELNILSKVSRFVSDKEQSSVLISLLLPYLQKAHNPQLNAFDSRHLDEIYFDVRLTAFQNATKRVKEMTTLDLDYISTIIHNCFHTFEIGDMSLADNATLCLSAVITQLTVVKAGEQLYKDIIQHTILDAVHKGLRSKTESVQHEYTTVLACLVKTFPSKKEFRDLVQLTNYNDLESDFFEHMKHIQIHRRGRALRKLAKQLTEGQVVMTPRSLQNYIMPYAMTTLLDEKMLKHENMISASVEVVGAVCRRLTWSKYLYYLKHFVHILQTAQADQKLAVSLLVTVLEAFHFDHETLSREMEAAKAREAGSVAVDADDEEQLEVDELDTSDDEETMETPPVKKRMSYQRKQLPPGAKGPAAPKSAAISSGLPQSKEELETLISTIHQTVNNSVLPRLHKCLNAKVKRDEEHKAVKSKDVKEEEVVRVPIAFAMVKLMQTLPPHIMEANLPGILIKVCVLLRNRFQEIRDVARGTLVKIIETLGCRYLHYLLKEMQSVLVKGYQIFNNELFGAVAEEKEVKGIVSKLMEARHSKSMDSYEFLAQFCSKESITKFILPLKEILETSSSLKVCNRVGAVLRRLVLGLLVNEGMTSQDILLLCHGLVSESLPLLTKRDRDKASAKPPPDPRLPPPSCLLLPPTPKRGGQKAPVSSRTNMHILVDAGLKLLHLSLKKSKVTSSEASTLEMLDPFVPLLLDCINSMHVKVITEALVAFTWLLKFPLPAVEQNAGQLTKQLFVLLKDYSKAGAARGENYHLVQNCFKAITILVKNVKSNKISETQLQVLLGYAEEDIYDQSRQATAFGLLKAILSRKLIVPEMEEVLKKVARLSVTGSNAMIRIHCRQVLCSAGVHALQIYLKYLLDYPLGRKLKGHLDFVVSQLHYEHDTGRESVLEMLSYIFQTFPKNLLLNHSGLFFAPLALVVVNDDSARCKKMAAMAIKALLIQLDSNHQNTLFSLVNTWLKAEKASLRRLGAQMCGLFVEVEEEKFARRLDDLLPLLEKEINPDNYEDLFGQLFAAHQAEQLIAVWRGEAGDATAPPPATAFIANNLDKKVIKNLLFVGKVIYLLSPESDIPSPQEEVKEEEEEEQTENGNEEDEEEEKEKEEEEEEEEDDKDDRPPSLMWLIKKLSLMAKREAAYTPKVPLKRTCVFKFLGAIAMDLGKERLGPYLTTIITPLYRELDSTYADQNPTLKNLAQELIELLKKQVGLERFSLAFSAVQKEFSQRRAARKRHRAMQAVANPDIAAKKKLKKHKNKIEAKKRKIEFLRPGYKAKKHRSHALKDLAMVQ